jgi:tetratricopeptide (TPR) repeat protein
LTSSGLAELSSASRREQTGEVAPANLTAQDAGKSPQNSLPSSPKLSSQVAQRLWKSRVSLPENPKEAKAKNELKHLIEQLRSVRLEPNKQTPEHIIAVEPVSKMEPNEALPATEMPKRPVTEDGRPKPDRRPPYEPVSDQTLQVLENLSQHPDQLRNPSDLAEVLFLSGHLKQAAVFYQQALRRIPLDDADSAQDRAWILFQTGNCLRDDDLTNAGKMYRQLITEYPNSPWINLAKARLNIIDWYQKSKPQTLIAEYGTEATQPPGL